MDSDFIPSNDSIQCATTGLDSYTIVNIVVAVISFLLILALLFLLWKFYKNRKKQLAEKTVKKGESIRKGDAETGKGGKGKGKGGSGNETLPSELSPEGGASTSNPGIPYSFPVVYHTN
jgi:hypothetical protein